MIKGHTLRRFNNLIEKITPEHEEDSKKLLGILDKYRFRETANLSQDEQDLLNKYDLKLNDGVAAKKADHSLKIRQGKLDAENKRLKDLRGEHSYQNLQHEKDAEAVNKNVRDFKHAKNSLINAGDTDADLNISREEARQSYLSRSADIDRRAEANNEKRRYNKDVIDKLLRRKTESVEDTAKEVQNPVYADATRDMEKTDKIKKDTTKIGTGLKHEEKGKNPKMTVGAKKMKLDESLFENIDEPYDFAAANHAHIQTFIESISWDPDKLQAAGLTIESANSIAANVFNTYFDQYYVNPLLYQELETKANGYDSGFGDNDEKYIDTVGTTVHNCIFNAVATLTLSAMSYLIDDECLNIYLG